MDRRQFVIALGGGAMAAGAGCLGSDDEAATDDEPATDDDGDTIDDVDGDASQTDADTEGADTREPDVENGHHESGITPGYYQWIGPGMLREEVELVANRPAQITEIDEFAQQAAGQEFFGIPITELEYQVQVREPASPVEVTDLFSAYRAAIDPADAQTQVESQFDVTLGEQAEYKGFAVYGAEEISIPASNDDEILLGQDGDVTLFSNHRSMFETAIDVYRGDRAGLAETDERFELAGAEIGDDDLAWIRLDERLDARAVGYGAGFAPETSTLTYAAVFPDGSVAETITPVLADSLEDLGASIHEMEIIGRMGRIETDVSNDLLVGGEFEREAMEQAVVIVGERDD